MSLRNRFVLVFALSTLAALAGCGSNSNKSTPPPTGGFTNSNLNGTYVFSFSGSDYTTSNSCSTCAGSFFSAAGTLSANGSGGLTGTIDLVDAELGAVLSVSAVQTGLSLTGNYDVTSDGRGTGTISFKVGSMTVPMGIDFVLTSNSHGLITRFDSNGTGSGTLDAQTSGITQSALEGSFAFGFSGTDVTGTQPLGTVGTFTLDANGNVTSGSQDFNDNGNSSNLTALSFLSPSTVTVGSTPGTAQLTTSATGFSTLNFDVWPVDASHLKFIETDGTVNLAGDAFSSTGQSFPAGTLVFTMSGLDTLGVPLAEGGLLTSDGTSTISGGLEDVNEEGTVAQSPSINGGISSAGGRTVMSLNGIYNGDILNSTLVTGNYAFVAYPYTYNGAVGVELLEVDNEGGITGGNAYLQSSTSIAASQGYGLNLSGSFETSSQTIAEADLIAEFTTSGSSATGLYDANNGGGLISDYNLGSSATYATGSNGRGTFAFPNLQVNTNNSVTSTLGFTYYTVDSSTAIFIETDSSQIGLGTFQLQNSSSSDLKAASLPHFSMVRAAKGAKRPANKLRK